MIDTRDIRQVENSDERRGGGSPLRGEEQEFVIVRQVEADEQQADDIDDGNTPECVLDCAGHRLPRIGGLRGGKTDELGAGKGKGSGDEDGADALESVCKCAGVVPILCANVLAIRPARGTTTAVKDDGDEYEHHDDEEFEARRPEFLLCVPKCPENVDRDDREL